MNAIKPVLLLTALLAMGGCSASGGKAGADVSSDETENVMPYVDGLQGKWLLDSYQLDCEQVKFDDNSNYTLSFNDTDKSFGMTTDCNMIGGGFEMTNDTIRFMNIAVTQMACHEMTVEMDMLRLLNDTAAYAVCTGDTIRYTAPSAGDATFVKSADTAE